MTRVSGPKPPVVPPEDWKGRSRFWYGMARLLVTLIVRSGFLRVRVFGEEHVPESGPVLLMANHESNLDPVLIAWSIARPIHIPGKIELFRVRFLGWLLFQLGSFPVDRETRDAGSLRKSMQALRNSRVLVVFPEGTRTRTGKIGHFDRTLTRVAARERSTIVPVAVIGTGRVLPPGARFPRPGATVDVRFGEPLNLDAPLDGKLSPSEVEAKSELIRSKVIELIGADAAEDSL